MKMKIGYLFTYGYSLKTWEESGTLNKELFYLKNWQKKKILNLSYLHMEMPMTLSYFLKI